MRDYDAIKEALTFYAATAETTRKTRALLDAADAIEELLAAVPKWISVEERLPETINAVLVYCPRNKCTYTAIWSGLKWLHFGGCRSDHVAFPVTHWMPLPSTEGLNEA